MHDKLEGLTPRYEVVLEFKGRDVVGYRLARVLEIIEEEGSILAAARALNIPYSRVWEAIARAERILGLKLVETKRGGERGGGAVLTREAKLLLARYREAEERLMKCIGYSLPRAGKEREEPDLVLAYSHDPMLEVLIDKMRNEGLDVEAACLGSGLALAALSLGEAYAAGIHLYDRESGSYNLPYIRRYWLDGRVDVIGGYWRELVFAFKPEAKPASVTETVDALLEGRLTLANRNLGSGTRVYLDHLLLSRCGGDLDLTRRVKGYSTEYRTHVEAARAVAYGRCDVALVLRYAAEIHGLPYTHVTWERYDIIVLKDKAGSKGVVRLRENLSAGWFKEMIRRAPGYSLELPKA